MDMQSVATLQPDQMQQTTEKMQQILVRSATDRAFRQKLLTDPRAAIAEFAGKPVSEVPASLDLVFVENKAGVTIVLPDPIDRATELSDQELQAVAGGTGLECIASILLVGVELYKLFQEF